MQWLVSTTPFPKHKSWGGGSWEAQFKVLITFLFCGDGGGDSQEAQTQTHKSSMRNSNPEGGGDSCKDQIQSPDQFSISGGYSWEAQTWVPYVLHEKFQSWGERGGGYSWLTKNRVNLWFWAQNLLTQASSCITDSLSHTMYMKTNEGVLKL